MTNAPRMPGMPPQSAPGAMDDPKSIIANSAQRLIQFCTLLSELFVLLVGILVAAVSLMSGVEIWMAALRSGAAMLSVGLILWFVNYMIARQAIEIAMNRLKDEFEREQAEAPVSTYERIA